MRYNRSYTWLHINGGRPLVIVAAGRPPPLEWVGGKENLHAVS